MARTVMDLYDGRLRVLLALVASSRRATRTGRLSLHRDPVRLWYTSRTGVRHRPERPRHQSVIMAASPDFKSDAALTVLSHLPGWGVRALRAVQAARRPVL